MSDPMERLTKTILAHTNDAAIRVYNDLELYSACAGIRDDYDNAEKAKANHYGHPGMKGSWVPAREYITNATDSLRGWHKRIPSAAGALQRVIFDAIQDGIARKQIKYEEFSGGRIVHHGHAAKAFGTTNSPKEIVEKVAQQMLENQLNALESVEPENTDMTKKRKKKRSTEPLIDYGKMKAATRCWTEYDGEADDDEV